MERDYVWVRYIRERTLERNKNFLVTLTGPTGSGKSWSSLSIGEMVDPKFNVDRVIFKGLELMNLINSGTLKSGSVIVWDEAGIDLSSRNWQSLTNKMLNYLLQTFRNMNFVLIFTVPYQDFLDVGSRKLFHADFETVSINRQKQTCRIKPKLLQYNSDLKKWYKKYLKVIKKDVGKITIRRWNIPKPSSELIKQYENKKQLFLRTLNKDIESKLQKEAGHEDNFRLGLTVLQESILNFWKKGIYVQKTIANQLNRKYQIISESIKWMRKKGCKIEDYRKIEPISLTK